MKVASDSQPVRAFLWGMEQIRRMEEERCRKARWLVVGQYYNINNY